jgi:hypothetical protein
MITIIKFYRNLQPAFPPIFLHQKSTKPKFKYKNAAFINFVQKADHKILMKLTPVSSIGISSKEESLGNLVLPEHVRGSGLGIGWWVVKEWTQNVNRKSFFDT